VDYGGAAKLGKITVKLGDEGASRLRVGDSLGEGVAVQFVNPAAGALCPLCRGAVELMVEGYRIEHIAFLGSDKDRKTAAGSLVQPDPKYRIAARCLQRRQLRMGPRACGPYP